MTGEKMPICSRMISQSLSGNICRSWMARSDPKLVEEVIGRLWKGKPESKFMKLINSIKYIDGAKELFKWLKKRGYKIAIISSAPKQLAQRAQKELGVDYISVGELTHSVKTFDLSLIME